MFFMREHFSSCLSGFGTDLGNISLTMTKSEILLLSIQPSRCLHLHALVSSLRATRTDASFE